MFSVSHTAGVVPRRLRRQPAGHLPAGAGAEDRRRDRQARRHQLRRQADVVSRPALPGAGTAEGCQELRVENQEQTHHEENDAIAGGRPDAGGLRKP